jgi:hypothetical protein
MHKSTRVIGLKKEDDLVLQDVADCTVVKHMLQK